MKNMLSRIFNEAEKGYIEIELGSFDITGYRVTCIIVDRYQTWITIRRGFRKFVFFFINDVIIHVGENRFDKSRFINTQGKQRFIASRKRINGLEEVLITDLRCNYNYGGWADNRRKVQL